MSRTAFKLIRVRKDGSLGPLFIDQSLRYEIGEWHQAKHVPKKGYAFRPGFHTTSAPVAPHLKESEARVWCEVEIDDYTTHMRPVQQGGLWFTSERMRVLEVLGSLEDRPVFSAVWLPDETIWTRERTKKACEQEMLRQLQAYNNVNNNGEPVGRLSAYCKRMGWSVLLPSKYKDNHASN